MARDTDRDWQKIAQENPYWGVLSENEYLGRPFRRRPSKGSSRPERSSSVTCSDLSLHILFAISRSTGLSISGAG